MMKFALVFVALVGMSCAAPAAETFSLTEDLQEFLDLIPVEEMRQIARNHLKDDQEFITLVKYLQGAEWAKLVQEIREKPAVQDLVKYMKEAGLDLEAIIKWIHDLIAGAGTRGGPTTVTVREFLDEIKAIIPTDKIVALALDKLQNSVEFQQLFEKISSDKAHKLVDEVRAMPEVQRLAARLLEMGIDITAVIDKIYVLFGWK